MGVHAHVRALNAWLDTSHRWCNNHGAPGTNIFHIYLIDTDVDIYQNVMPDNNRGGDLNSAQWTGKNYPIRILIPSISAVFPSVREVNPAILGMRGDGGNEKTAHRHVTKFVPSPLQLAQLPRIREVSLYPLFP